MRLANELTLSSPILRNQTFSQNLRHWFFFHLRPVLFISLAFPSLSIHFVHDLRCKSRKPTVICDTHTRVMFSGNYESSALSFHVSHNHFQNDRWPCDHPPVVHAESLPLPFPHMRESPHLEVLSYSVHYRISKRFIENQDLSSNHKK